MWQVNKSVHVACNVRSRSDQLSMYSCYRKLLDFNLPVCEDEHLNAKSHNVVAFSSLQRQLSFDQGGACFVMPPFHTL